MSSLCIRGPTNLLCIVLIVVRVPAKQALLVFLSVCYIDTDYPPKLLGVCPPTFRHLDICECLEVSTRISDFLPSPLNFGQMIVSLYMCGTGYDSGKVFF